MDMKEERNEESKGKGREGRKIPSRDFLKPGRTGAVVSVRNLSFGSFRKEGGAGTEGGRGGERGGKGRGEKILELSNKVSNKVGARAEGEGASQMLILVVFFLAV